MARRRSIESELRLVCEQLAQNVVEGNANIQDYLQAYGAYVGSMRECEAEVRLQQLAKDIKALQAELNVLKLKLGQEVKPRGI